MGCGGEPTATGIFHYFSDTAKGNLAGPDVSRIRGIAWPSAICHVLSYVSLSPLSTPDNLILMVCYCGNTL